MPLPLTGTSKPLCYQKDGMQFHMDNGNIEEALHVAKVVSHADVVHEIKKLRKYPNHSIYHNDELDACSANPGESSCMTQGQILNLQVWVQSCG